ncbi:MG2 domain-containing protein [Limibacter armeniacum]|uniref:MG2 domain-containing protein n=1 Tax=Limibacter armeniacum TaxID=466084 RepID=UPI002FE64CBC
MKRLLLLPLLLLTSIVLLSFVFFQSDPFDKMIAKLAAYTEALPQEKIYVQMDKPFYKPGDNIWLSVFLVNEMDHLPSTQSQIANIELVDPKGETKNLRLICNNGRGKADFKLPSNAPGGLYKIKAHTQWMKNFPDEYFFEKSFQVQAITKPNVLLSLDFERKAYGPSEKVVANFAAQSLTKKPLANQSFMVAIKLENKLFKSLKLTTDQNGKAAIQFDLPENLKNNDALLNITIENNGSIESISRAIPIMLQDITLQFFPESGHLVENVNSKVAFKATDAFGKPVDIEGVVLNKHKEEVTKFRSFHDGMGAFEILLESNEAYTAYITHPVKTDTPIPLPEALSFGFSMSTGLAENGTLPVSIHAPDQEIVTLILQVRNKPYYYQTFPLHPGVNSLNIPLKDIPAGIAHLTLFDNHQRPCCERLNFINSDKQMKVSIETDKEKYLPYEEVKMMVKTTDETGQPISASLALSVVDDKVLSFADDKQDHLLSYLLLSSDLKGEIHEPIFYFDTGETKAAQALDYLLMTQGWRKFNWREVMDKSYPEWKNTIEFQAEQTKVKGQLLDNNSHPLPDVDLKLDGWSTKTDKNGNFSFSTIDLSTPKDLEVFYPNNNPFKQAIYKYKDDYSIIPTIKGKVTDDDGNPIPNVSIYIPESGERCVSNQYGQFSISALISQSLAVNKPGFQPLNIKIKNSDSLSITLQKRKVVLMRNKLYEEEVIDEMVMAAPVVWGAEEPDFAAGNEVFLEQAFTENDQPVVPPVADEVAIEELKVEFDEDDEWVELFNGTDGFVDIPFEEINEFYEARTFYIPDYKTNPPQSRTDFRETIYWNPVVETGSDGTAQISFYTNAALTSFSATAQGISATGKVGRSNHQFYSQMPVSIESKAPEFLTYEDQCIIPITLKNNTESPILAKVKIQTSNNLKSVLPNLQTIELQAYEAISIPLQIEVQSSGNEAMVSASVAASDYKDSFSKTFKVVPKGFPVSQSFSGNTMQQQYSLHITDMMPNTLTASAVAYPDMLTELMAGVESILQEPYGCFEQTSSSTYPNILALQFMRQSGQVNPEIEKKALALIDKGYKKLISFETKENGYEWFGGLPAHEGLTAYGLLEFSDMEEVYASVDNKMVARTRTYLMDKRDGKGGYITNKNGLDSFGNINKEVYNAYVTYALVETGHKGLEKEIDAIYDQNIDQQDVYKLSLLLNILLEAKDTRSHKVFSKIKKLTDSNGFGKLPATYSVTMSGGKSLQVETTSFLVLGILKMQTPDNKLLQEAANYLVNARESYGGFGSTQATIMALKALTEFARYSKVTKSDGDIILSINNQKNTIHFEKGSRDPIQLSNLNDLFKEGNNTLNWQYKNTKQALPYSITANWYTYTPPSSDKCDVSLDVRTPESKIRIGDTFRAEIEVRNKSKQPLPMVLAKIGILSGVSVQPWQIKALQEKHLFDYYEITDNYLILYFRGMKASEKKVIQLDLKSEFEGKYFAPASCAYLYYTAEYKHWIKGISCEITQGH